MKKFDKAVEEKLASMNYKNSIIDEYNNTIRVKSTDWNEDGEIQ